MHKDPRFEQWVELTVRLLFDLKGSPKGKEYLMVVFIMLEAIPKSTSGCDAHCSEGR
jgi:hypothetical protein